MKPVRLVLQGSLVLQIVKHVLKDISYKQERLIQMNVKLLVLVVNMEIYLIINVKIVIVIVLLVMVL